MTQSISTPAGFTTLSSARGGQITEMQAAACAVVGCYGAQSDKKCQLDRSDGEVKLTSAPTSGRRAMHTYGCKGPSYAHPQKAAQQATQQASQPAELRTAHLTLQRQKWKRWRKCLGKYFSTNREETLAAQVSAQFGLRAPIMNTGRAVILCGKIFVFNLLIY